jgi:hypothetical protein
MVNTIEEPHSSSGPRAVFWPLVLAGFPFAAIAVTLLLRLPILDEDGPLLPLGGGTGVAAAVLLALLPNVSLARAAVGGLITAIATVAWLFAFLIGWIWLACALQDRCLS